MTTRRRAAEARRELLAAKGADLDAELDRAADKASMFLARRASLGGRARAKSLSPSARREIAKRAAAARWGRSDA